MRKPSPDMIGKRYGKLTIVAMTDDRQKNAVVWECRCDCGNTIYRNTYFLNYSKNPSCGCYRKPRQAKPKPIYPPFTDCVEYSEHRYDKGCELLTEKLCATRGECVFYNPKPEEKQAVE